MPKTESNSSIKDLLALNSSDPQKYILTKITITGCSNFSFEVKRNGRRDTKRLNIHGFEKLEVLPEKNGNTIVDTYRSIVDYELRTSGTGVRTYVNKEFEYVEFLDMGADQFVYFTARRNAYQTKNPKLKIEVLASNPDGSSRNYLAYNGEIHSYEEEISLKE